MLFFIFLNERYFFGKKMVVTKSRLLEPKILAQTKLDKVIVLFSERAIDFGTLSTSILTRILEEDKK